jgi:hypothetical protein
VAVSPDGQTAYALGESTAGNTAEFATIAYAASDGRQLWVVRQKDPVSSIDIPSALVVGPHGQNLYEAGYSAGSTLAAQNWLAVAYKA